MSSGFGCKSVGGRPPVSLTCLVLPGRPDALVVPVTQDGVKHLLLLLPVVYLVYPGPGERERERERERDNREKSDSVKSCDVSLAHTHTPKKKFKMNLVSPSFIFFNSSRGWNCVFF